MKLSEAKKVLEDNGYTVEEQEVRKNGQLMNALTIGDGAVRPSIYEKTVENMETKDQLLDLIKNALESTPDMSGISEKLQDPEYILQNCYSCLRPASDDTKSVSFLVYGGELEEYIRISIGEGAGGSMSTILSHDMLRLTGLQCDEVRDVARENLRAMAKVQPMEDVLMEITGMSTGTDLPEEAPAMLVASTKEKHHGAGIILLDDYLQKICEKYKWEGVTILPSSIHECILLRYTEDENEQDLNAMIEEVNRTQVAPEEVLGTHVFHYYAA